MAQIVEVERIWTKADYAILRVAADYAVSVLDEMVKFLDIDDKHDEDHQRLAMCNAAKTMLEEALS